MLLVYIDLCHVGLVELNRASIVFRGARSCAGVCQYSLCFGHEGSRGLGSGVWMSNKLPQG